MNDINLGSLTPSQNETPEANLPADLSQPTTVSWEGPQDPTSSDFYAIGFSLSQTTTFLISGIDSPIYTYPDLNPIAVTGNSVTLSAGTYDVLVSEGESHSFVFENYSSGSGGGSGGPSPAPTATFQLSSKDIETGDNHVITTADVGSQIYAHVLITNTSTVSGAPGALDIQVSQDPDFSSSLTVGNNLTNVISAGTTQDTAIDFNVGTNLTPGQWYLRFSGDGSTTSAIPFTVAPSAPSSSDDAPSPFVELGDGTHLGDIFGGGESLAKLLKSGFDELPVIEGYVEGSRVSKFVTSIARTLGVSDDLAGDAGAFLAAQDQNINFQATAKQFGEVAEVLGTAANVVDVMEGVSYLLENTPTIGQSLDAKQTLALQKISEGGLSLAKLSNFVGDSPAVGIAGPLISNATAAFLYAKAGDYNDMGQALGKAIAGFGFGAAGALIGFGEGQGLKGAQIGVQEGVLAAGLASQLGEKIANHFGDTLLNSNIGQASELYFYNHFLKH